MVTHDEVRRRVVSILRDLPLEQCRAAYEKLDPWWGYVAVEHEMPDGSFRARDGSIVMRHGQQGDIEIRAVFGPPGWDQAGLR